MHRSPENCQSDTRNNTSYIWGTGYDFTGRALFENCDLASASPICFPPSKHNDNRHGNFNPRPRPWQNLNPKALDNGSALTPSFNITRNEISVKQCDQQLKALERRPNVFLHTIETSAPDEEDPDNAAGYDFFSSNLTISNSDYENVNSNTDESFGPGTMNGSDTFLGDNDSSSDDDSGSSFSGSDSSTVPFPPLSLENLKKKLSSDYSLSFNDLISLPVVESKLSENTEPDNVTVLLSVPRSLNSNVVHQLDPGSNSERTFGRKVQNATGISTASLLKKDDSVEIKKEPFWLSEFSGELKSEIEIEDMKIENFEDAAENDSGNNITSDQNFNRRTPWNGECEFQETKLNINKEKLALLRRYIMEGDEYTNVIEEQTCSKKPKKRRKKNKNKEEATKKETESTPEDVKSIVSNTILRIHLTRCSSEALQIIENDDSERKVKKLKKGRKNSTVDDRSREKENSERTEKNESLVEPSVEKSDNEDPIKTGENQPSISWTERQKLTDVDDRSVDEGREKRESNFPGFVFKFCQSCGSVTPVDWFYTSYVTNEMKCLNCFRELNWSGIEKFHRMLNEEKTTNNDAKTEIGLFVSAESSTDSDAKEKKSRPVTNPSAASVPSTPETVESIEEKRGRKRNKSWQKLTDDTRKSKDTEEEHKDIWQIVRGSDSSTEEEVSCVTKIRLIKKKEEYLQKCSEIFDKVSEMKETEPGNSDASNEKQIKKKISKLLKEYWSSKL